VNVHDLDRDELVRHFVDDSTLALLVVGSFARGDAGPSSDVDLARHVVDNARHGELHCLADHGERLVTVKMLCAAREVAALLDPGAAVWQVPTLRDAVILFDRDGNAARLIARARAFSWTELDGAADRHVATEVADYAEEELKIVGGLADGRPGQIAYGVMGLVLGLAEIAVIHRREFIVSENRLFDTALEVMTDRRDWCEVFRRAAGYDEVGPVARGRAALQLYQTTVDIVTDLLDDEQRALADLVTVQMSMLTRLSSSL
jgi:hypothetical protein